MSRQYSIGEVSSACETSVKTLHYYDEIGLLTPEFRDENTNYRYYSKRQMTTLLVIRRLRAQGFSLKEIEDIIHNNSLSTIEKQMQTRIRQLEAEINLLSVKKEACQSTLERIHKGLDIITWQQSLKQPEEKFFFQEISENRMLYLREVMPQYDNADVSLRRWTSIYEECTRTGVHMKSPIIVTYYDQVLQQYLMTDCDVEFGVLIDAEQTLPKDTANVRTFGGFLAACVYHIGEYKNIMQSQVELMQWIARTGKKVAGPVSEQFLISPLDIDEDALHITKIIVPVEEV